MMNKDSIRAILDMFNELEEDQISDYQEKMKTKRENRSLTDIEKHTLGEELNVLIELMADKFKVNRAIIFEAIMNSNSFQIMDWFRVVDKFERGELDRKKFLKQAKEVLSLGN